METGHRIHTACTHIHSLEGEKKMGIQPRSTAQCTVWLCITLYTVYPRNPHISMCVYVFVCVHLGVRGRWARGWGMLNQIPGKQSSICVFYNGRALGNTERWKHWPLSGWLHVGCMSVSLAPLAALFHLVSWHVAVPKNTVLSSPLPTERSV